MPRTGTRPHVWKVQGLVPHQQYIAWQRAKAQAAFRDEAWTLTFEQFQTVWCGQWERRGRLRDDYCMTREDSQGAWSIDNVKCIPRLEYLRKQAYRN